MFDREGLRGGVDIGRVENVGEFNDVVVAGSLNTERWKNVVGKVVTGI